MAVVPVARWRPVPGSRRCSRSSPPRRRRGPGHLVGEVRGRVVGVGARGRELFGESQGHRGLAGATAIESSAAGHRQGVVGLVTPLRVALMVEVPMATRGQSLAAGGVGDRRHRGVAEAQVTWLVRFWVELSLKVPVAVNCSVNPRAPRGWPASPRSTPCGGCTFTEKLY